MAEAIQKKKTDFASAEFLVCDEGLCVQCTYYGSCDNEPATIALMDSYASQQGYVADNNDARFRHKIHLNDIRKAPPEKLRTAIRPRQKNSRATSKKHRRTLSFVLYFFLVKNSRKILVQGECEYETCI